MTMQITSPDWDTYALLDSGKGRKLEQFGDFLLIRPETRALWKPAWSHEQWAAANAEFVPNQSGGGGKWQIQKDVPERWQIHYRDLKVWLALEESRQVGVFPENAAHWDWIEERIRAAPGDVRVLNLFGYTGIASLAAARAGAAVTHIDSSRRAINFGRENQALNGLEERPIRWIDEDAVKFAEREVRRGNQYDGIIFDPPKYGLGPKRERWSFFENFNYLCEVLRECLNKQPLFVVVTAYALESPPDVLEPGLRSMLRGLGGKIDFGTLTAVEKSAGRKIDLSITARWSAERALRVL